MALITAIALLLAYSRRLGDIQLMQAFVFAGFALIIGGLFGLLARQLGSGLLWAVLTSLLVYLAVAGGRLPNDAVIYGWGMVAAICGASNGVRWPIPDWICGAISAGLAGVAMWGTLLAFGVKIEGYIWFDVVCAIVIGVVLTPAIRFLQWFQKESQQPAFVLAAWLSAAVLLGNLLVPILGGLPR